MTDREGKLGAAPNPDDLCSEAWGFLLKCDRLKGHPGQDQSGLAHWGTPSLRFVDPNQESLPLPPSNVTPLRKRATP